MERGREQPLAREGDTDTDRQSLPERTGRDVDPGQDRRGMTFEPRPEPPEGQELGIVDRAGGAEHRVDQRRCVTLREDEVIVRERIRPLEVVAKVTREQDRHEVGR